MYLKAVYIEGFKSFAKKTKIEFNKDITAVVGPNGSGKSNISDAIMWALGESSVKNLRGQKMEDIIFSGTDKRHPLGLAQVTIIFDNSERILDTDFTEVSVTRRMFRSLESEFLINNVKCRLKDIKELFMDTGIGKDGYSLIGQGKIESILSNKPEDRRAVFEEAAGISKYKFKKKESLNKLQRTKDNLTRLSDIISEIEKQEGSLKLQMLKAKQYLRLFNDLKEKEVNFVYFNNIKLENDLKNLYNYQNDLLGEIKKLEESIDINNKKEEELENSFMELEVKIDSNQEILNKANFDKQKSNSNIEIINGKVLSLEEKIQNAKIDRENNELKIEKNKEILDKYERELEVNTEKIREINNLQEEYKIKFEDLKNEIIAREESDDLYRKNQFELENEIKNLCFKNETLNNIIKDKEIRSESLKSNIINFENNQKEFEDSLIINQDKINKSEDNLKGYLEKLNELKAEISTNTEKFDEDNKTFQNLSLREKETYNKLTFLKNISENYEGYNSSVKSFMNFSKKRNLFSKELLGTVGDNLIVDKKYKNAISVALGGASQNIIVEKLKYVSRMIELLQKEKFGRVTFMPLDNIKPIEINFDILPFKAQGAIDFAINLVSFDKKYYNIYSNLLGKIIVCDNFKNASNLQKIISNRFRLVTLEGDIFNTTGSITGGYINKTNIDLISRKRDLKDKEIEYNKLQKEIADLQIILNERLKKIDLYTNKVREYSLKVEDSSKIISNYKIAIENIKNSKINNNEYLERYRKELEEITESLISDKNIIELNNVKLDEIRTNLKNISTSNEDKSSILKVKKDSLEDIREQIHNKSLAEKEFKEKRSYLILESQRLKDEIISLKKLIEESISNDNICIKEIENNNKIIKEEQEKLIKVGKLSEDSINSDKELREKKKIYSDRLKLIRNEKDRKKEELLNLTNSIEKNKFKIERKEESLNLSVMRLKEEYGIDSIEEFINKDLGKVSEKDIKKMKKDINDLGPVNLNSINEYQLVKERLELNLQQRQDLLNSSEEIENILRGLDKEMKEVFKNSFSEISKNFNKIFNTLFDGGKAEIELTGAILDGGIEIKAMPPGKRLQALSLLSGGEKALTAVALLFALLKVRPAPFCILDEIDAALDDANIKKYSDYLKTFDNIQFIIITHRKLTMEIAKTLYGVTMEEKGISKIYSLKLE